MPQTSNYGTWCNCVVKISTNCSDYTDISGWANSVSVSGGARKSSEAYTFDGDTPLLGAGPREPLEVTVTCIYDEETVGTPYDDILTAYETDCGGELCVEWQPFGSAGSTYETDKGGSFQIDHPYQSGDKGSSNIITFQFTVKTEKITKS